MKKEELLDKYIKYNSKITFDIFKLIYQKLIDLGFASPHTVENAFKEFSGKYSYFIMILYPDGPFFNQHTCNLMTQSEISVEDLLGYNPFESFKLPKQWYIEVGENAEIINKWKQTTEWKETAFNYKYVTSEGIGYYSKYDYTEYSEITIEQFKQYVLKEPLISKPIKPFPTHWCIKLTKETIPIVGVYYNKKHLSDPNCDTYTGKEVIGKYVKSHNIANDYIKNGYTSCSFFDFSGPSDSYPEITLEQFKEFVMNEPVKIETIPESKVEEIVPEYVECFYSDTSSFIINKIYKCESFSKANALNLNSEIGFKKSLPYKGALWKFKPSTKEAFEAQNKPKSIEKWSAKTYIVCIKNYGSHLKIGDVAQIDGCSGLDRECVDVSKSVNNPCMPFKTYCEWFATQPEAEEFAKTLVEPVKSNGFPSEGCCKSKSSELEQYLIKTRGNSDSKMTKERANGIGWNEISYWWLLDTDKSSKRKYHLSDLNVWLDKPKQPLKQAVHCKTQEEWDFVTDKLGYKWTLRRFDETSWISLNANEYSSENYWKKNGYQILSFQEWCDLKGYKYATTEEAKEYERLGKPYNVESLKKEKRIQPFSEGTYAVCTEEGAKNIEDVEVGDIFKFVSDGEAYFIEGDDDATWAISDEFGFRWFATLEEAKNFSNQITPAQIMYPQTPTLKVWLEETKAMNLDLKSLADRINRKTTCSYLEVYCKLEGDNPIEKAHNLLDIWGKDPLHIKPIKVKSLNSTQLLSMEDEELPMVSIIKTKTVSILSIN